MKLENALWTEKYRPSDFSDIKGQKDIVKRVKAFVEQHNLPHLMFAGPAGVGKTSLALVIAKKLFKDLWHQNFLELNASDERGIDIIRNKVKDFARTRAIGDVPFKIIYLDECDALTREAQQALRRTMENYTQTCRFVLSANYSSKIIDPIQSRCVVFRFKQLDKKEIFEIIDNIAKEEKLKIVNVRIEGTDQTRAQIIKLTSQLTPGSEITGENIQRSIKRLWGLGVFSHIQIEEESRTTAGSNIVIKVKEVTK